MSKDTRIASSFSSNIRKRGTQKRVVSVPIKDVERLNAPPPDSWAWRKYGQKPIKGSPYPRGYYRCSSSKGCPARKQVERSRVNPSTIVVTYSCEHNHPLPACRSNNHRTAAARNTTNSVSEDELEEDEEDEVEEEEEEEEDDEKKSLNLFPSKSHEHELISEDNFSNIIEGSQVNLGHEFEWFADFETSTSCTLLESPILTEDDRISADNERGTTFTVREGDESDLFADLGELPECSTVFR